MSGPREERDAKNWLVSAQAGLIAVEEEMPDLEGRGELGVWIALAQAEAMVAIALELKQIREALRP